jgi:large subunit ribosomal protein L31e
MIREFARKHMKTQEIKIDEEVAHLIWSKGVRSPPRKIRVRMTKTDDGFILVSKYEGESESEEKDTKKSPEIKQEPELQIEDPDAIEVTEETLKEDTAEIEKPKEEKPKAKESKPKADKPKADKPKEEKPKAKESKSKE